MDNIEETANGVAPEIPAANAVIDAVIEETASPQPNPKRGKGVAAEVPDPNCTCDEEYTQFPCPVHRNLGTTDQPPKGFGENIMVITDADINVEQPYGRYEGHLFICHVCKVPSIMANENMGECCVKCGAKVIIRSAILTKHIRAGQLR